MEVFVLNSRIDDHSQLDKLTENRLSSAQTCIQDDSTGGRCEKKRNSFVHLLLIRDAVRDKFLQKKNISLPLRDCIGAINVLIVSLLAQRGTG